MVAPFLALYFGSFMLLAHLYPHAEHGVYMTLGPPTMMSAFGMVRMVIANRAFYLQKVKGSKSRNPFEK
ncbi:hypothetical protein [Neisseria iguanae]|uniref:hypothetical protein n=1 Tax=Neisseria iguanae TaxID=90242 RepID=UPI0011B1F702|nr:hypothetical protein [Neisseria iguanae]